VAKALSLGQLANELEPRARTESEERNRRTIRDRLHRKLQVIHQQRTGHFSHWATQQPRNLRDLSARLLRDPSRNLRGIACHLRVAARPAAAR